MRRSASATQDELHKLKGVLQIVVRDAHTKEFFSRQVLENLVVSGYREQILHALTGDDTANAYINRIEVGTSGVVAAVADTAIVAPTSVAVVASYPAAKQVRFVGTMGSAEGNGKTFQEAGLVMYSVTLDLVTRRVFAAMAKTADFEWEFTWTLEWA